MATVIAKKSSERWSDEDVSALLSIYSEDATQRLLLKAVSNTKMYDRCSLKLRDLGIFHNANSCRDKIKKLRQDYKKIKDHNNKSGNDRRTSKLYDVLDALLGHRPSFSGTASTIDSGVLVWEAAEMADSVVDDDDEEGAEMGQLCLETSELSPPDRDSSPRSSPLPPNKRKGKWARDESFLDTIAAMEDRRAMASKESEDRRAMAIREMHDEQMLSLHKSQETDDNMVMVMSRQADAMSRQAEVSAQQQQAFQVGLLAVLSELVKSNRHPSL
ncbi:uncharacterized protein LOC117555435 [Gymnodraco acuticeps]|uniref:Uncharacterized protein LOC117555435 n=1 Tax=Gymnodraco acuticeps TaxID=8218 RepID=A0A6P8WFG6_GYMAC|nr:uncharacterized protein LOC117555435 [Gymnodraco acuticeps]